MPRADLPSLILRADILHCIGLSLLLCAVLVLRRRQLLWRVLVLVGLSLFPVGLHRTTSDGGLPGGLSPLAALFCDVPPYTRFRCCRSSASAPSACCWASVCWPAHPVRRRLLAWLAVPWWPRCSAGC